MQEILEEELHYF